MRKDARQRLATSNVVLHNRLQPVFVDVDPHTYNMDPALIEANIKTLAYAGVKVTADQLFDMSIIEEVYKEDPSLV